MARIHMFVLPRLTVKSFFLYFFLIFEYIRDQKTMTDELYSKTHV